MTGDDLERTCEVCGGPMTASVVMLCFGGGQGGRITTWQCPSQACRAARDDAAINDAIARGVIDP